MDTERTTLSDDEILGSTFDEESEGDQDLSDPPLFGERR